jgi:hypothetical protein
LGYLCFTPDEYRAVESLCRPLNLSNTRPQFLKRILVASLAESLPHLAERIARLNSDQFRLLLTHLQDRPSVKRSHGLTAAEVELVAEVAGPWLAHARFAHLLKRSLVRRLAEWHPDLAMKVDQLSLARFSQLAQQVSERTQGNN